MVLDGLAKALLLSSLLVPVVNAQNPVLGDIKVRSFLGEPLNLRVALAASTAPETGAICQSVIDSDRRENTLRGKDLILTMVELRDSRYLQIRSHHAINEPVARFLIRIGCPGEPAFDREFTVLLDPPPSVTPPLVSPASAPTTIESRTRPTVASAPTPRAKAVLPAMPALRTWSAYEGDTLASLAKRIYPKDRTHQRRYIATLRALNPQVSDIADDAPLAPGAQLAMPDLRSLAGASPRARVVAPISRTVSVDPAQAAGTAVTTSAISSATVATSNAVAKVAPMAAIRTTIKTESIARGEGFTLRLSGSEIDLTRSRNVSDEQRRQLREKQLMLDADDQVATLLSLQNSMKQMEQRLNEIQLKQTAELPIRDTAPAAFAGSPVTPAAQATREVQPAPAAVPAAPDTAPKSRSPEKSARPAASLADTIAGYLTSPLAWGGIAITLLALLAARVWSRRDGKSKRARDSMAPGAQRGNTAAGETSPGKSTGVQVDDSAFAEWEKEEVVSPLSTQPRADAHVRTVRGMPDELTDIRSADAAARAVQDGAYNNLIDTHSHVDAPVVFDDTPASYELDTNTATAVDFLVGMDEKLPEDRVRRLQYMHERYPELKTNTVSIDDADSIITAARLYYEEGDRGNGREKASELLTFAVEERPQEIRFWLAQFEIFRLENMVAEFHELAGKFHVLFSHTAAWPKVRHVGHELDPGNPLFAASGSPLLAGETRFDPIAENWLNAPMDFTSDALMSDLRLALLDDHGVSRADFDSITARFSTPTGLVQ